MVELVTSPEAWIAFATLTALVGLTAPLVTVPFMGQEISGRDLILIVGGLFLLWKSTMEIHQLMEGEEGHASGKVKATFGAVLLHAAYSGKAK